jgi:serine/threonine-protein kinase
VRESRTAAAINHPNIVTVYDAGEADGLLYIAMHFVEGTDLAAALDADGALPLTTALEYLEQIGSALDAAHHHGIVHRDVKPANVLLEGDVCLLTDFGLTAEIAAAERGKMAGTADYMSPEQVRGDPATAQTDVYALGCLAFVALTATVPFDREDQDAVIAAHLADEPPSINALRPDLPPGFDDVIARALAKEPAARYETAGAFVADLRERAARHAATPATTVLVGAGTPAVRALVRASLDPARFAVDEAATGEEAVALAARESPALVLLEAGLDGGAAAEVAGRLRATPELHDGSLVLVCSREQARAKDAIRAAGFDDALAWPFSPVQLHAVVRDLLGAEALDG